MPPGMESREAWAYSGTDDIHCPVGRLASVRGVCHQLREVIARDASTRALSPEDDLYRLDQNRQIE